MTSLPHDPAAAPTWGVVSTIRAPTHDILNFAAHHLDMGAQRVHIYLDQKNPQAQVALRAHPQCRVILTDDGYWKRRGGRPEKHQPRQTKNASHCYRRRPPVDWLLHADVDEFLWPDTATSLADQLSALPGDTLVARISPIEALAPALDDPPPSGAMWFKGCSRLRQARMAQTPQIYPNAGQYLNGGFLSHVQGKIMLRTGLDKVSLRIHNAYIDKEKVPGAAILSNTHLCHLHAPSLEDWLSSYRFRLQQGSYRASLGPAPSPAGDGISVNQLFTMLENEDGENALRQFYQDVCVATPALRERLNTFGHLHQIALDLDAKRARHFPNHA